MVPNIVGTQYSTYFAKPRYQKMICNGKSCTLRLISFKERKSICFRFIYDTEKWPWNSELCSLGVALDNFGSIPEKRLSCIIYHWPKMYFGCGAQFEI